MSKFSRSQVPKSPMVLKESYIKNPSPELLVFSKDLDRFRKYEKFMVLLYSVSPNLVSLQILSEKKIGSLSFQGPIEEEDWISPESFLVSFGLADLVF